MNLSFLIPVKLESEDRVRNLTTVLSFLSKFNSQILIKESDISPKFESFVLPNLKNKPLLRIKPSLNRSPSE